LFILHYTDARNSADIKNSVINFLQQFSSLLRVMLNVSVDIKIVSNLYRVLYK